MSQPLSSAEAHKLFDDAIEEGSEKVYTFKHLFGENSYLRTYKFSEEQLKEICIASKCKVHIPTANILFRIEQHYREKIGQPIKNKLSRNKQNRILFKSIREYNRKREFYDGRQEKREICTKEIRKRIWVKNRIEYFHLLNLGFFEPAEICDENGNVDNHLEEHQDGSHTFEFRMNESDIHNFIAIKEPNSEPIGSYTDFQSITIITSTQQQTPI